MKKKRILNQSTFETNETNQLKDRITRRDAQRNSETGSQTNSDTQMIVMNHQFDETCFSSRKHYHLHPFSTSPCLSHFSLLSHFFKCCCRALIASLFHPFNFLHYHNRHRNNTDISFSSTPILCSASIDT